MIIFNSESFELEYHPETQILELRWVGIIEIQIWELLLLQLIKAADAHEIKNILLDASYVNVQQSIPALLQVPIEQLVAGLRYFPTLKKIARVASSGVHYEAIVQKQYTALFTSCEGIEFRSFEHHYLAIHWITGKPS